MMNPLPSLLRASAWDAGNRRMRAAGRTAWSRGDFNEAARTQTRLVKACFGRPQDDDQSRAFIRFQIAEAWEKAGHIGLKSDWPAVLAAIEQAL